MAICALPALPLSAARSNADSGEIFRQAARRAAASVVTIETIGGTQPTSREGRPSFIVADGPTTGLIWSADGLILTSSFNFVRDPSVITVVLADGRRFVARMLARDEIRRLTMLEIDADDLPVPAWVESGGINVGQWAVSLGRGHGKLPTERGSGLLSRDGPEGAAQKVSLTPFSSTGGCTITAGIISGLKRMSGLVIQTDAKLSPANFGGPLIDIEGRVLGLSVPLGLQPGELSGVEWYDSGIGFAVPAEQVRIAARALSQGRDLRSGLLGLSLTPDTLVVMGCGDPSPARTAGIEVGDRLMAVDGDKVQSFAELKRVLRPRSAGTKVTVTIEREDQSLELPVTLATPDDIGPVPEPPPTQPESDPQPASQPKPKSAPASAPFGHILPPDHDDAPIVPPATGPA